MYTVIFRGISKWYCHLKFCKVCIYYIIVYDLMQYEKYLQGSEGDATQPQKASCQVAKHDGRSWDDVSNQIHRVECLWIIMNIYKRSEEGMLYVNIYICIHKLISAIRTPIFLHWHFMTPITMHTPRILTICKSRCHTLVWCSCFNHQFPWFFSLHYG